MLDQPAGEKLKIRVSWARPAAFGVAVIHGIGPPNQEGKQSQHPRFISFALRQELKTALPCRR